MSLREMLIGIGFDINDNPLVQANDQVDSFSDNVADVGDAGETAFDEVTDSVSNTTDEMDNFDDKSNSIFDSLVDNWGKITVGASAAGAGIEAMGRKQKENTEITDRSAKAIGVTSREYRSMATEISNVTFPLDDVLSLMETGRQQGIESAEALQEYATFWDTVGDATGLAGPALGEASAGLRAVGVAAGNESEALAAFGYITESTTGEVDDFLHFLERTGPQLSEMGMDVDDAAAMLGILEHELGMSGRTARSEFRKAVNESDGDLKGMMDTLGISEEVFGEYTDAVAESSDVIQDNADIHGESYTVMEKLQHWMSEVTYTYGPLIEAATMFVPIMLALGPAIKGVSMAMGLFNTALLASPITWIVLGVVALVGAVIWAYNEFEWFAEVVNNVWSSIVEGAMIAWQWLMDIIQPAIGLIVEFVMEKLDFLMEFWNEHGTALIETATMVFEFISMIVETSMQYILGIFQIIWPLITAVVEVAWSFIETIIDIGLSIVTGLIEAGLAIIEGDWGAAWDAISGILSDVWSSIQNFLSDALSTMGTAISDAFSGFVDTISEWMGNAYDTVVDLWGNVSDFFTDLPGDMLDYGKNIMQGLIDGIANMKDKVLDTVSDVAGGIKDGITGFFGINSPADLTIGYGGDIGTGMQIGLDNSAMQVARSAQNLAESADPSIDYTPESGGITQSRGSKVYHFSPQTTINVTGDMSPEKERETERKWKRKIKEWYDDFNDEKVVREV